MKKFISCVMAAAMVASLVPATTQTDKMIINRFCVSLIAHISSQTSSLERPRTKFNPRAVLLHLRYSWTSQVLTTNRQ